MNKNDKLRKKIKLIYQRINFYRFRAFNSMNMWERIYCERMLCNELMKIDNIVKEAYKAVQTTEETKEFTLDELKTFDGTDGKPAYVAVNGKVYDVSLESTWGGGTHYGLLSGKDLTDAFMGCHGDLEILNKLPIVGVLVE